VEFPGTAIIEVKGDVCKSAGPARPTSPAPFCVFRVAQQVACFLTGTTARPVQSRVHDHTEAGADIRMASVRGHSARAARDREGAHSLEAMNYSVKKILLMKADDSFKCNILIVAGPKQPCSPAKCGRLTAIPTAVMRCSCSTHSSRPV
jgi:hypothetical protein